MVDLNRLVTHFAETYGDTPRVFSAPGRVNLIGEHTDYNDGFVLPIAIDRRTYVAIAPGKDRRVRVASMVLNDAVEFELDQPSDLHAHRWARYVAGVAWTLNQNGVPLTGADMMIDSDVPIGAGLSSSAALEVATGKALTSIADQSMDARELALAAQQAEHDFAGAKVGIMDHFAAMFGRREHALLIDCRSLDVNQISLANLNATIVVCNTNVKHDLASSAYNEKREDCERGVELLRKRIPGIRALGDVSVADFEKYEADLPEPVRRRCRHVVTENERTLKAAQALATGNREELGNLMLESHASLKNDYQVSCRELNLLVDIASGEEAVFGARLTGGGFGGCTINLVRVDGVEKFTDIIKRKYRAATNLEADLFVITADDGAREEIMREQIFSDGKIRTGTLPAP